MESISGQARRIFWLSFCSVIIFVIFYQKLQPLSFHPIQSGLDPSWQAALAYSAAHGLSFGSDVLFTGGPLSFLYTRQFSSEFAYATAIVSLSTVVFLAISIAALSDGRGSIVKAGAAFLSLGLTILTIDSIFLLVPLLMGLHGLKAGREGRGFIAFTGAFLSGIIVLAKFSVFPVAVLTVLTLDAMAAFKRRIPFSTLFLIAGMSIGWVASGQAINELPSFIAASMEVSTGYSSAMSIASDDGPLELVGWLCISALFVSTLLVSTFLCRQEFGFVLPIARLIVIGGYFFVAFKAGMVRHDLHSLIAWGALTAAVAFAALAFRDLPRLTTTCLTLLAALLVLPGHLLLYREHQIIPSVSVPDMIASTLGDARALTNFVAKPSIWFDDLVTRNEASAAAIRQQARVPSLDGTVDIIPSEQADLIANNLAYSPRPTVQEYTTYSSKLIARNRAFFSGARAPDHLILQPGSIDGRHPASAEGPLWPLFFSRYEPVQSSPLGLVLKKRETPIPDVLKQPIETSADFGHEISFPATDQAWMVSIDIRPTLLGRLVDLVYRPPMTQVTINYINGTSQTYRIIPGMTGDGMLISPEVRTSNEYLMVSTGHLEYPALKYAKSFVVETGLRAGTFYHENIGIKFSAINHEAIRAFESNDFTRSMIGRTERVIRILENNSMQPPMIDIASEGIFAHAPATLRLPVTAGGTATFFFGLREGSWSGETGTNGVCFAIRASSGNLAERCLDPVNAPSDRGEQKLSVVIPDGVAEVLLETTCRQTCDFDWSYWGGVELH